MDEFSRNGLALELAFSFPSRSVIAVLDQRPPGGIEMHQVPADRIVLEHESMQAVSVMHQEKAPPVNSGRRRRA